MPNVSVTECMVVRLALVPLPNRFRSLHNMMAATVDALHTSNLRSHGSLRMPDLVSKIMELLQQLEGRRASATGFSFPVTDADIAHPSSSNSRKHDIVLTLYYYRALMLINSPLLLAVLRYVSNPQRDADVNMHLNVAMSLLQNYLRAIIDFHKLLCGILSLHRAFLRCNAVWWLCNYMSILVLHPLAKRRTDPLT